MEVRYRWVPRGSGTCSTSVATPPTFTDLMYVGTMYGQTLWPWPFDVIVACGPCTCIVHVMCILVPYINLAQGHYPPHTTFNNDSTSLSMSLT